MKIWNEWLIIGLFAFACFGWFYALYLRIMHVKK